MAQKLTDSTTDDAGVAPDLLDQIPDDKKIVRFTGDGAYDQNSIYETFAERGARVVVPPLKNAVPARSRTRAANARNKTVNRIKKVGRRQWKKETRYHRQARAENTFFRYKALLHGSNSAPYVLTALSLSFGSPPISVLRARSCD